VVTLDPLNPLNIIIALFFLVAILKFDLVEKAAEGGGLGFLLKLALSIAASIGFGVVVPILWPFIIRVFANLLRVLADVLSSF